MSQCHQVIAWECQSSWLPFPNANMWLHRDTCFFALCIPLPPGVAWAHLFPLMPCPNCQGAVWHNIHVVSQWHYVEAWSSLLSCLLRPKTTKRQSWNACLCTCYVLVSPHGSMCMPVWIPLSCCGMGTPVGMQAVSQNHHYVVALAHLFAGEPCPKTATWHCMHTCSQLCHVPRLPREGLCVCMLAMYQCWLIVVWTCLFVHLPCPSPTRWKGWAHLFICALCFSNTM